jgi:2-amino-4-hydroxy-6-hydroxymethyldihydropteridine diphosphokinase
MCLSVQPTVQKIGRNDAAETALIALGANLPSGGMPPAQALARALALLAEETGAPVRASRLYRTPAFPPGAGPDFVNAAAALPWHGTAAALLAVLHRIEAAFGRTRRTRWEARMMDLDLLALGAQVLPDAATQIAWADLPAERAAAETPQTLILPHPRLAERGFVLVPLADVAPDWRHPLTGRRVAEMVAALPQAVRDEIRPLPDPSD